MNKIKEHWKKIIITLTAILVSIGLLYGMYLRSEQLRIEYEADVRAVYGEQLTEDELNDISVEMITFYHTECLTYEMIKEYYDTKYAKK